MPFDKVPVVAVVTVLLMACMNPCMVVAMALCLRELVIDALIV